MPTLQVGYPKSGNYWMYKIIQSIHQTAGVQQKNFIKNHPIYPFACKWELSYPEQVNINMMDILYPACFFRISSIFRMRIQNIEEYVNSNTHVWSHSNVCPTSHHVFPLFDNIIYIIRDPRDVILSKADFAFTPYMKKHYPTWHSSPSDYLEKESLTIARAWKSHIEKYLEYAKKYNILILFYEQLKESFENEFDLLLKYMGYSFSKNERLKICKQVSSKQMRKESPQHVRKAIHYKWKDTMTSSFFYKITSETEDLLGELGYPLEKEKTNLPEWKPRFNLL